LEEGNVVARVLRRFFSVPRGQFYVFFIILLIVWAIARNTIITLLYRLLKCICMGICGKKEDDVFAEDAEE